MSPRRNQTPRSVQRRGRTRKERHISVRSELRDPPDLHKLGRALAGLALAQMEADAQRSAKENARQRSSGSDTTSAK